MTTAIAVCIEREAATDEGRFVRCTARSGREAGLAIGLDGSILWCSSEPVACDLWVTGDARLVVVRGASAGAIQLERGERHLELPIGRAVVVLHQDVIVAKGQRFRVHVHGATDEVHPPTPLRIKRGMAVVAAMALSLGCSESSAPPGEPNGGGGSSTKSTVLLPSSGGTQAAGGTTAKRKRLNLGRRAAPSSGGTSSASRIEVIDYPPY